MVECSSKVFRIGESVISTFKCVSQMAMALFWTGLQKCHILSGDVHSDNTCNNFHLLHWLAFYSYYIKEISHITLLCFCLSITARS